MEKYPYTTSQATPHLFDELSLMKNLVKSTFNWNAYNSYSNFNELYDNYQFAMEEIFRIYWSLIYRYMEIVSDTGHPEI